MTPFYESATHIKNRTIMEWKKTGRPIVGYTCSYAPAEIFHAADILPVRLRGIETDGMEIADAYYGPFVCSFPKCVLQLAGKGAFSFLDGAIITSGCDSMRRLDECWRKAGEDYPGILPPYFYYFDVPHKVEPHGMDWFIKEIGKLIKSVENHFKVKITSQRLSDSIKTYNKARLLFRQLEVLRADQNTPITGTQAFAASVASVVTPREDFTRALEQWIKGVPKKSSVNAGKKRLLFIGSISDEIGLAELIEDTGRAIITGENLCFGVPYASTLVSQEGDPVAALAAHYLGKSICPRMYGRYRERLGLLIEKIQRLNVDGVVMQNIRFCDLHGAENALFERDLEAMGTPCIRIEREYGPLTETGRIKLRLNAFLERISRSKAEGRAPGSLSPESAQGAS